MNTTFTEDGISEEKISEKASRVRVHLSTGAYPKGNKKACTGKKTASWEASAQIDQVAC